MIGEGRRTHSGSEVTTKFKPRGAKRQRTKSKINLNGHLLQEPREGFTE